MTTTVNIHIKRVNLAPPAAAPSGLQLARIGDLLKFELADAIASAPPKRKLFEKLDNVADTPLPDLLGKAHAIRVAACGAFLPDTDITTPHVAVLYPHYGVMTHPFSLGNDDLTQRQALEAASKVNVLGFTDWKLASRAMWERLILDTSRRNPAVDPVLYPGVKAGLHWTSTTLAPASDEDVAGDPAFAWVVGTGGGGVVNLPRDLRGFGLAARFVGQ